MAISFVQGAYSLNAGTGQTISIQSNSTIGSGHTVIITALTACISNYTAATCTDDKGNTYKLAASVLGHQGNYSVVAFYCLSASGGPQTFTITLPSFTPNFTARMTVDEFSGINSFDISSSSSSGNSPYSLPINPANPSELIYGYFHAPVGPCTGGPGFTQSINFSVAGESLLTEYLVQTTQSPANVTFSGPGGENAILALAFSPTSITPTQPAGQACVG